MEGTKMKKSSFKKRILLIIIAVAVVAVVIVFVVIPAIGGNNNQPSVDESTTDVSSTAPDTSGAPDTSEAENDTTTAPDNSQIGDSGMDDTDLPALIAKLPDKEALAEIHSLFSGFWTSGDKFVGFIYLDDGPAIYYGLYETSFGNQGKIIDSSATGTNTITLTIKIPAVPASEMEPDGIPEKTETISIDISNYNDNRLNIKIANLGDGEWSTYEYGGGSIEDAFNV
jgi:cytoskeletal protein RodZ